MFPWFDQRAPESLSPDRYPIYANDPHKRAHLALNDLLQRPDDDAEAWLDAAEPHEQAAILQAILIRLVWLGRYAAVYRHNTEALRAMASRLLRRRLPLSPSAWEELLTLISRADALTGALLPLRGLLYQLERLAEEGDLDRPTLRGLERLLAAEVINPQHADGRQLTMRVERLLGREPDAPGGLEPGDPWADEVLATLHLLPDDARAAWQSLWAHGSMPGSARPTQRWLRRAAAPLEALSDARFTPLTLTWLRAASALLRRQGDANALPWRGHNEERLKELTWAAGAVGGEPLAAALGELAEAAFRKSTQGGPRAPRLGHACLAALGLLGAPCGLDQLARLQLLVRYPSAQRLIVRELVDLAQSAGLEAQDLDDLSPGDHHLDANSRRHVEIGAWTSEISISDQLQVEQRWRRPDGQLQKTTPASLKRHHEAALDALAVQLRDLQAALHGQRERLERSLRARRTWTLDRWRDRYLDHPLLAPLTRALIWQFLSAGRTYTASWHDGALVDVCDRPLLLDDDALVTLWHPAEAPPTEALMWRTWLHAHQREQPLKQAHREVYRLTPNPDPTPRYSDARLAGRFLKQHQLAALCQQRGWRYHLQGVFFDQRDLPTLALPDWNLEARLEVYPVLDQALITEARICLFVTSGPLRFVRPDRPDAPIPLDDLHPRVLSEVLRDLELFISVTDQGSDPTWVDHALPLDDQRPQALGPLDDAAQARRALLRRVAPLLDIAPHLDVQDRFLAVQGHLQRYRIHLGSAHVLDDRDNLLPLLPDRAAALRREKHRPQLPYDDDQTLALILSKARLLANDHQQRDHNLRALLQPKEI